VMDTERPTSLGPFLSQQKFLEGPHFLFLQFPIVSGHGVHCVVGAAIIVDIDDAHNIVRKSKTATFPQQYHTMAKRFVELCINLAILPNNEISTY